MATTVNRVPEKSKPVVIENFVIGRPPQRTQFDIASWRSAIDSAELMYEPNRVMLYDIYSDALLDPHLSRQWEKRVENITNTNWLYVDENGKEVSEVMKVIDTLVFENLLKEAMGKISHGITLLELGITFKNIMGNSEKLLTVYSVPRKHIRPDKGTIVKEQYDSQTGQSVIHYREGQYANYCAEIGEPKDLGILLNVVPYVLLKKGGVSDWALFVQLFGQPFREYRYNGYDDAVRVKLEKQAQEMASAPYIILPDGSTITLHEVKNSNSGEVHSKLVQYCDEMISIRTLGNTETTKSSKSSGYAQAEIHSQTQSEVYSADKQTMRRVLNSCIAPILYNLGFPVVNGRFIPREEKNLKKVSERLAILQQVKLLGAPIDDQTIYNDADVAKPNNYDELKKRQQAQTDDIGDYEENENLSKKNKKPPTKKTLSLSDKVDKIFRFFRLSPVNQNYDITGRLQQLYYGHACDDGCQHEPPLVRLTGGNEWELIINDFARQLHDANINGTQIHNGLYFKTAQQLSDAIIKGLGSSFSFNDPLNGLQQRLLSNVYLFSGVKSLTEASVFSQLLTDENGDIKLFSKYRQDIEHLHGVYNEQYLSAEYGNAIAAGQMAEVWHQYSDDDWLEYRTAGDERVRHSHNVLDGVIQQKKSTFWKTYFPPNGWNCRCHVVPANKPAQPLSEKDAGQLGKGAIEGEVFENNVGESGIVFTDDHPYFKSAKGIKELDAVRNYGLKPVEKILSNNENLPASLHLDTVNDYYKWWDQMVRDHGINANDFALRDKLGIEVLFETSPDGKKKYDFFRDHIIRKAGERRHEYASNLVTLLQQPDELWNIGNVYNYIGFFADGMYLLSVINAGNIVKAETMFKVQAVNYGKYRKGILLHKK